MGAGPIGALMTLACARAGAAEIIVSDLLPAPLELAAEIGATATMIPGADGLTLEEPVDVVFEASGAPAGLRGAVQALRRGGRLVLIGMLPPGDSPLAANRVVTGEIEMLGSFRFTAEEFQTALGMLAAGLDVAPLITAQVSVGEAREAFELASDRARAMKVQLTFDG